MRDAIRLAEHLAAVAGLVAHRYGALDWRRIHEIAATRFDDLLAFGETLALRV